MIMKQFNLAEYLENPNRKIITKDNVKVEESEKENSEELYSIHSNFLYSGHEWDIWVTIQEKEIQ